MRNSSSFPWIGVIADELCGALACGARLSAAGLRTVVVADESWPQSPDAIVVNVGTRLHVASGSETIHSPPDLVRAAARRLVGHGCSRLELRVDAMLRRDYSDELQGLIDGAGLRDPVVLAVPAYPSAGRHTHENGRQLAMIARAQEHVAEIAPLLFGASSSEVLTLEQVQQGPRVVSETVSAHIAAGRCRRFIAEATTDQHLRCLAEASALLEQEHRMVTVSSGAWLRFHPAAPIRRSFTLIAMGLATAPNELQLDELTRALGRRARILLPEEALRLSVERDEFRACIDASDVIVIKAAGEPHDDVARLEAARRVAETVDTFLAAGHRLGAGCRGIVATGAYTVSCVASALGAHTITPMEEADPLCPVGALAGGQWTGLRIVAKGGMVGGRDTLTALVDWIAR